MPRVTPRSHWVLRLDNIRGHHAVHFSISGEARSARDLASTLSIRANGLGIWPMLVLIRCEHDIGQIPRPFAL